MESTRWEHYGRESGNPKCANCMVHSGYEASAVDHTFSSIGGFLATVKATLFGRYRGKGVPADPVTPDDAGSRLVQLNVRVGGGTGEAGAA